MRIPTATYRIQFNSQFTFRDAKRIVAYLDDLGITDVYSSPLLRPRKGSMHGYDIVDANSLNPELGTDDDFTGLHGELHRRGMGLLLDIVPNHMAASHENQWWASVLENGPQSRFLHFFDIDWRDDKVLLPILGRPYGEALQEKEIQLGYEDGFQLAYYDKYLPLAPHSYRIVLEPCVEAVPAEGVGLEVRDLVQNETVVANSRFLKDTLNRLREQSPEFRRAMDDSIARHNADPDRLDRVIQAQWYRLAYWRIASETINYRRFFDVTDLVGIRVENPEVFEARNKLILELIAQGKVTGVRIDHIDGLFDPVNYLAKLQLRLGVTPSAGEGGAFYVTVEKILEHGEPLPPSFQCAGTTGYDFLDTANALFVDPAGLGKLTDVYHRFTGLTASYEDIVYERKKQVIDRLFFGEMRALGAHLTQLAGADRNARDLAPSELLAALVEITACMPVYRTYITSAGVNDADRGYLGHAIAEARRRSTLDDAKRLFDFVELVLLLQPPKYIASERDRWLEFVMRWQQFTGRVMAKGVEDTAFYNYNRLISLNEVGGEPGRDASFDPVAGLHARNEEIARRWPHTMNATSTHDTKRSEDVRARIHVLSEIAEEWEREVKKWARMNAPLQKNGVPHPNEELLVYQTLAGAWPIDEARLHTFLEKAAREAKTHSSWIKVDEAYESALKEFASALLRHDTFVASFQRFHRRIAFHGFLNSLAQVVVKVCSPGVPDFYQGTELWDFSLVDPDNRRPVDYAHRARLVASPGTPHEMLRNWQDGRIKLFVTSRALAARRRFAGAPYRAVDTGTPHAVAFLRGDDTLVTVPRLTATLVKPPDLPLGDVWAGHALPVEGRWRNIFTGETLDSLELRNVFASFPVAILERA